MSRPMPSAAGPVPHPVPPAATDDTHTDHAGGRPLRRSAERLDGRHEWLTIRADDVVPAGWRRCSEVDGAVIAEWEERAALSQVRHHGRSHPTAAASYALGWYADIAARVGGMCLLLERRVPRLARHALAFACHGEHGHPDAVSFLDSRFWCLPDDVDASHPDATVVPDDQALATILRREVRAHADDFLATYRPGVRLPRRDLLGAFYDGLDGGFWRDDPVGGPSHAEAIALARATLPGATPEFAEASSLYLVEDPRGGEHLARLRVSCCNYYRISDADEACTSCPRTSADERRRRLCAPPA